MTPVRSSIRTWALVAVGVTSGFLIGISLWLISILSAPDWCNRAIGAKILAGKGDGAIRPEYAVTGCYELMKLQLGALANNSYVAILVIAMCLLVLVVIVLAGGRLSFKASRDGVEGNIGKDGQ